MRRSSPHFDSRTAPGGRKVASLLFSLFLPPSRLPCLYCSALPFLLIPRKEELLKSFPKPNATEPRRYPTVTQRTLHSSFLGGGVVSDGAEEKGWAAG